MAAIGGIVEPHTATLSKAVHPVYDMEPPMHACGDVVTYGWIDSMLEIKKENNTRAWACM